MGKSKEVGSDGRPTRVLMTVPADGGGGNPYIDLLCAGVSSAGAQPLRFSWKLALTGRYDVVHFNWPEHLFVSGSKLKVLPKLILSSLFLLRVWLSRVPAVMTIHNVAAHEAVPGYVRFFAKAAMWLSELVIYLNESDENDLKRGIVILHQTYPRVSGSDLSRVSKDTSTILYFGSLRPYKGLEDVISAFDEAKAGDLLPVDARLVIAGEASSADYAASIGELCRGNDFIDFHDQYLSETELERRIAGSIGVVLPYKRMYNSGAAILSLGLGTRVLVPSSGATVALREEFPTGVTVYEDTLRGQDLVHLVEGGVVDVHQSQEFQRRRSVATVGELHRIVYTRLTTQSRWRLRRDRRRRVLEQLRSTSAIQKHSPRNCADRELG